MDELRNVEDDITEELERAINAASRFVDGWKGRDYFLHDYSVDALVIRGGLQQGIFAGHFLLLPYSPIIELDSVTVNDEEWTEDEDFIRQTTRLVSINGPWPVCRPTEKVEIAGKFGYDQETEGDVPTNVPSDIVRATILIAAAFSGHNQKSVVGVDGGKIDITDKNIPKAALDILGERALVI